MFSRSLRFRLAGLYSAFFLVCAVLLFAFSYLLLYSWLRSEENRNIRTRLLEFWALYQSGGVSALATEIMVDKSLEYGRPFLLRVADRDNRTLFLYLPSVWRQYPFRRLEFTDLGGEGEIRRLPLGGSRGTLQVAGLRLDDGNLLQIGFDSTAWERTLQRFRGVFLLVTLPLLAASFAGGLLFSGRALQPVQRLIRSFRSIIATGRIEGRVSDPRRGDELAELVSLYNAMLARIEALIRGMREALDNVAHDLRTPLTRLRITAEAALQSGSTAKQKRAALEECLEEAGRILTMLRTLTDISEAETGVMRLHISTVKLSELVGDILELYGYAAGDKHISLESSLAAELTVQADADRLRQVLANLLDNAVKYTPEGGRVAVAARREGEQVEVTVSDTGVGIPPEELHQVWERLFRGDRSRSTPGLGLGLSLVRAIVQAHGGTVSAASTPGQGACFSFRLPVVAAAQPS
jgi:signal transduction histidine kinase